MPEILKKAQNLKDDDPDEFVCVAWFAEYSCLSTVFAKKSVLDQISVKKGPSVNLATGFGGSKTTKRGSISLDLWLKNAEFYRIINCHFKYERQE